jgi:ribosomal protein S18 acetylase RimI-like enzyme
VQVSCAHECLTILVAVLTASIAATQVPVHIREYAPREEYDYGLTRRLSGIAGIPRHHGHWPRLWDDADPRTQNAGIDLVAEVDGLIVGRAFLEAHHHPYCELVNLGVRPDYEGMGVATALVREAITRARALGLKVMVLQEGLDEAEAHGIYEKAGFVRATRGDMQRMVKLLDVPLVSGLLKRCPEASFASEPAPDRGDRCWKLSWEGAPDDFVSLYLFGGSCQYDSDGFQPVIGACELAAGEVALAARVECAPEVAKGQPVELLVTVENRADSALEGCVRTVLLPDTELSGDGPADAVPLNLPPGAEQTVALPIRVTHHFRCDFLRFGSYPSVPLTAELCWPRGSVLLSRAARIRDDWDGSYP